MFSPQSSYLKDNNVSLKSQGKPNQLSTYPQKRYVHMHVCTLHLAHSLTRSLSLQSTKRPTHPPTYSPWSINRSTDHLVLLRLPLERERERERERETGGRGDIGFSETRPKEILAHSNTGNWELGFQGRRRRMLFDDSLFITMEMDICSIRDMQTFFGH